MLRAVLIGSLSLVMAFLMPALLLSPVKAEQDHRLLIVRQEEEDDKPRMIRLGTGSKVIELPLETYLLGVVLSEMPASFHQEALKAQAVASRTFSIQKLDTGKHTDFDLCDQSSCCQAWCDWTQLAQKLGSGYEIWRKKAEQAIQSTSGQVLTYEDEIIEAVYFSCSGGMTEDAVAVWGSEVPYLQAVVSPGEEQASKYTSMVELSLDAFRKKLPESDLTGDPITWFGARELTEGGGVATMEIGGKEYTGTALRALFDLNSTMFSVSVEQNAIVFHVKGYGHRVGMSQYGANAMAEAGETYDQILQHYYPGTMLEEITTAGQ